MSYSVIGVDLGQAADYTAIVVIEPQILSVIRTETIYEERRVRHLPIFRLPDGTETSKHPLVLYHLRYIERLALGTRYPDVVRQLRELRTKIPNSTLAVDASGVGRPVIDLLESAGLACLAITITGGNAATSKGSEFCVPKRDLVSCAQVLFQNRRLKIARGLPLADVLVREL